MGWYEIDPNTGKTVGVTEDGGHQGIVAFSVGGALTAIAVYLLVYYGAYAAGYAAGLYVAAFEYPLYSYDIIFGNQLNTANRDALVKAIQDVESKAKGLFGVRFAEGFLAAVKAIDKFTDPPLPDILTSAQFPASPTAHQGTGSLTVAATVSAGSATGNLKVGSLAASGQLRASWANQDTSGFSVTALNAAGVTVRAPAA